MTLRGTLQTTRDIGAAEIAWRDGYFILTVFGCIFGLDMFGFWFLNGVLDFSTGLFIGSLRSLSAVLLRAQIYIAIVPVFIICKLLWHRIQYPQLFEEGLCPVKDDLFNLDWFTNAVMLTAFPLALQAIGTWVLTTLVFILGIFVVPKLVTRDAALRDYTRLGAVGLGIVLMLWLKIPVPFLPSPSTVPVVQKIVSVNLTGGTVMGIYNAMNSVVLGPFLVTFVSLVFAGVFTSSEFQRTPLLERIVPEATEMDTIVVSSFFGTLTYLGLVWVFTGSVIWFPSGVIAVV